MAAIAVGVRFEMASSRVTSQVAEWIRLPNKPRVYLNT